MRVPRVASQTAFGLLLAGIVFGSKASAYAQSPSGDQNGSRSQITYQLGQRYRCTPVSSGNRDRRPNLLQRTAP